MPSRKNDALISPGVKLAAAIKATNNTVKEKNKREAS
jgi:hypothetical protein